jgi:RNA polymerase sigma factor (sigma-70 family)
MTAPAGYDGGTDDAALAIAVAAGDVRALGAIYDRYATRLLGFCRSMLHNPAEAEDCLQDVFVIAATRLSGLREPALLRSWLFSVARHECLARIDKRKREVLVDEVADRPSPEPDPAASAALDAELAALLRDAQAGLSDRDRLLLELADRQQLAGDEFAAAVGVPRSTAYTLLARARTTAKKSIGALLVARTGRERCAELDALLAGWDGELTVLSRKQIARHIEKCAVCDEQRSRVASAAALLGGEGEAFAARLVALRSRILDAATTAMRSTAPVAFAADGWPPPDPVFGRAHRRRRLVAGLLAAAVVLLLGGVVTAGAVGPLRTTTVAGNPGAVTPSLSAVATTSPAPSSSSISVAPSSHPPTSRHHSPHPSSSASATPTPSPTPSSSRPTSARPSKTHHSPSPHPSTSRTRPTKPKTSSPTTSSPAQPPPPPPKTWVLTVQPSSQSISSTWNGTTQTCPGSAVAIPAPCSYKIDDGTPVTIDIGREWRYDSPPECTDSVDGICSLTMDSDKSVTVHVS